MNFEDPKTIYENGRLFECVRRVSLDKHASHCAYEAMVPFLRPMHAACQITVCDCREYCAFIPCAMKPINAHHRLSFMRVSEQKFTYHRWFVLCQLLFSQRKTDLFSTRHVPRHGISRNQLNEMVHIHSYPDLFPSVKEAIKINLTVNSQNCCSRYAAAECMKQSMLQVNHMRFIFGQIRWPENKTMNGSNQF